MDTSTVTQPRRAERLVTGQLKPVAGVLECRARRIELAFDTLPGRADWEKAEDGSIRPVGPMNRCTLGGIEAQGCLIRMLETPAERPRGPRHAVACRGDPHAPASGTRG